MQFSDNYAYFIPTKNWSIFHSARVCSFADPVPYRVDSYNCPKTVLFVLWRSQVMFQNFDSFITWRFCVKNYFTTSTNDRACSHLFHSNVFHSVIMIFFADQNLSPVQNRPKLINTIWPERFFYIIWPFICKQIQRKFDHSCICSALGQYY